MIIAGRKYRDVDSITYRLFGNQTIVVKFKVKITQKSKTKESIYHSEFDFNDGHYITLAPTNTIEIDLKNDVIDFVFIDENTRARLIRKLSELAKWVDGTLCGDLDMLTVGSTGTRLKSNVPKPEIILSKPIQFIPFYNAEICKIQIALKTKDAVGAIELEDFMNIFYKIRDLNFQTMSMEMLNYYLACGSTDYKTTNYNSTNWGSN